MPHFILRGVSISYDTAGDGFPLLLLPGADGSAAVWEHYVPLFAELCRTITYVAPALTQPTALALLSAFLDMLHLERVYLACQADAWPLAVQYAWHAMARLEGLIFLGVHGAEPRPDKAADTLVSTAPLHTITVPTLVLLEAASAAGLPDADVLRVHFPHSTCVLLAPMESTAPADTSRRHLGHAMMRFLLHCERQRNLVRGASFLL